MHLQVERYKSRVPPPSQSHTLSPYLCVDDGRSSTSRGQDGILPVHHDPSDDTLSVPRGTCPSVGTDDYCDIWDALPTLPHTHGLLHERRPPYHEGTFESGTLAPFHWYSRPRSGERFPLFGHIVGRTDPQWTNTHPVRSPPPHGIDKKNEGWRKGPPSTPYIEQETLDCGTYRWPSIRRARRLFGTGSYDALRILLLGDHLPHYCGSPFPKRSYGETYSHPGRGRFHILKKELTLK